MSPNKKVVAVIPAFNEERTISDVVVYVRECVNEVIVVNDSSTDNTARHAKEAGAHVLNNQQNLGYDASISRGFQVAYEKDADVIVTCDADGQHRSVDIKRVIEPVLSDRVSMGIGQRQNIHRFGERVFAFFVRKYGIRDPLCGLKSYSREVYETVGYFDSVGSIGTELMLTAIKLGFTASFVDITIVERKDNSRFYKYNLRGNLKILKAMILVLVKTMFVKFQYNLEKRHITQSHDERR